MALFSVIYYDLEVKRKDFLLSLERMTLCKTMDTISIIARWNIGVT